MAAVINLDTVRLTRNIEEAAPREALSAEIILFPGIRYERWDDETDSDDTVCETRTDRVARRD